MSEYRPLISILCFVHIAISVQNVKAEQAVQYYKAGNVGAYCANVEVPANIDVDKTVFTARASNKKLYLLYVESTESVAKRLAEGMWSIHRLNLSNKNLWAIGSACLRYSGDYDRKFPPNLQELVEKEYLSPKNLESPFKPKDFEGPSYIYISEQRRRDHRNIIAYENPEFCSDKINVLFVDQHVEAMTPEGLLEKLEATYKRLRREMPEISVKAREPARPEPKVPTARYIKVFGRFQGSGKVKLSVYGRDSAELLARPRLIASVELKLPSADGGNAELLKQWATFQANEYMVRVLDSPYTSYYQYCLLQSKEKYGISDSLFREIFRDRRERRGRSPELYAMTTGALAIQESLQLEEMTGQRNIPLERNVLISTLEGPSVKSHPFDEMLQGRSPKTFPVAGLVPYDNYYCHFTSISKEIAASDLFKQWGASLLRSITVTARDSDLQSRYMNQLCIDISELTRLLGDFVIGEIAITGGDPFLREGTDIAFIIKVKNRMVFNVMMKRYANGILRSNRDAKTSESKYEGISIRSIVTPDRRISSHSTYLGNYKVYSNSIDTLKTIIDTNAKKRKSMADNLDFQYMRTIFPGTAKDEDGFIYMSDSFIRKLLSARWKIEAQRRIICQTHLRMIANAATMYGTEMRKKPSIETLIEEKYLSEKVNRCPDGGTYSLGEPGRSFCTVHNCLQYCTPISSVAIEQIAEVEAKDYKQFVRRYNSYWSRFFDPIGIRLQLGNRIEAETCILPLIENSIYNQLREIVGGEPTRLDSQVLTDHTIASISSKIHTGKEIQVVDKIQNTIFPNLTPIRECIGDNLSLNFYDSDVLFTSSEQGMGMFGRGMDLEGQIIIGLIVSSINLPVYAVLDLKDEDLARTFIRDLVEVAQRQSTAKVQRGFLDFLDFAIQPYSAGRYKSHTINTLVFRLFVVKFRLHYTIASGRLIVSTKRYVLEKVLDSLDKMRVGGNNNPMANVQLNIRPRAVDKLRSIIRVGWQERMREACLKNIEPVRVLVEFHDATGQTLDETSKKVEGVTLRCPSGGIYKHDVARGIVYCTVHGNCNHPRQPVQVRENEGLVSFINRITNFFVRLRFTEEGIMTKVAFELEPAKKAK